MSIPAVMLLFFIVSYLPTGFWRQNFLFDTLLRYAMASFGLWLSFYFYPMGLMNRRKRFRLSIRSALVGLKLISMEENDDNRHRLIDKHIKWVRNGFQSYCHILYKKGSVQIEIANIDEYYQSLCCTALIGQRKEIKLMLEQLRRALTSVRNHPSEGCDDVRQLLTSLKNVKNLEGRKEGIRVVQIERND
jgi:hypothetical protein